MSNLQIIVNIVLVSCRILMGWLIIYSGALLVRGEGGLATGHFDSVFTGVFVILLGFICIVGAFFPVIFNNRRDQN